jgi:hypothetical protein
VTRSGSTRDTPPLSVVLCTWNPRGDIVARVLAALAEQTLPADAWELIVVDNASNPPVDARLPAASGPREVDFFAACRRGHPLHMSATVVPRTAALAAGGFPEGVAFCEDWIFWCRMALHGRVVLMPEILCDYDVGVPGQAVAAWADRYKREVLEYHRFLAALLHAREDRATTGSTAARGLAVTASCAAYCRHYLRMAVLQRAYHENFAAVRELWDSLGLDSAGLGPMAATCAWIARHRTVQPAAAAALRVARALRSAMPACLP